MYLDDAFLKAFLPLKEFTHYRVGGLLQFFLVHAHCPCHAHASLFCGWFDRMSLRTYLSLYCMYVHFVHHLI